MIKKIELGDLIRCKFWLTCGEKDCRHHGIHRAEERMCFHPTPVHYCEACEGFVYDIHVSDMSSSYDCDPNLAFKARRESRKAEKKVEEKNKPQKRPRLHHTHWAEF